MDTPAGDPAASIASARENEIRVTTVLQLLQSRAIAELVVRDMALDDDREFNPKANPDQETPSTGPIAWLKRMFAGEPAPVDANRSEAPIPITTSDAQLETVIDRLMDKVSIRSDEHTSELQTLMRK